ncbi:MAG: hypothetical protein L6Q29_03795 [Candidatus Pacebacteria bacterium]|nr:hypothetical protein [Candidatus Paceibacterota bacterium]NUQ57412.1 hypothetical protein [Candidatus Paceibacter sp.]
MKTIKKTVKFFDKTEDKIRSNLSHHPIIYATIGAVGTVLLWRGVWMMADALSFWNKNPFDKNMLIDGIVSVGASAIILLGSGLFVSFFIGDRIILSGLNKEKKLAEKTEEEIKKEVSINIAIAEKMEKMERDLEEIKEALSGEPVAANNSKKEDKEQYLP